MSSEETDSRVQALLRRLDAAWEESRWHSLRGSLEGLTEDEATWVPPDYQPPEPWGFSGCILDILLHVAADAFIYPDQAVGQDSPTTAMVEAQFHDRGGNLQAALGLLDAGHAHLRDVLASLNDADLARRVEAAGIYQGASVETLFIELIEHDVYHAGQINYIRSLYEGGSSDRSW